MSSLGDCSSPNQPEDDCVVRIFVEASTLTPWVQRLIEKANTLVSAVPYGGSTKIIHWGTPKQREALDTALDALLPELKADGISYERFIVEVSTVEKTAPLESDFLKYVCSPSPSSALIHSQR